MRNSAVLVEIFLFRSRIWDAEVKFDDTLCMYQRAVREKSRKNIILYFSSDFVFSSALVPYYFRGDILFDLVLRRFWWNFVYTVLKNHNLSCPKSVVRNVRLIQYCYIPTVFFDCEKSLHTQLNSVPLKKNLKSDDKQWQQSLWFKLAMGQLNHSKLDSWGKAAKEYRSVFGHDNYFFI